MHIKLFEEHNQKSYKEINVNYLMDEDGVEKTDAPFTNQEYDYISTFIKGINKNYIVSRHYQHISDRKKDNDLSTTIHKDDKIYHVDMRKYEDEWFLININIYLKVPGNNFFLANPIFECDQLSSVIELFTDLFK